MPRWSWPPLWIDADIHDIPEPAEREISELFWIFYNSWLRHLDVSEMHGHRSALNVNAWDEVPDSSWFTNRIGRRPMDVEEFLQGAPGVSPEPGRWEVQELKTEGYTVGFEIIDSADRRYVLKFDRPEAPERNSAAEKIGSLIVHAARIQRTALFDCSFFEQTSSSWAWTRPSRTRLGESARWSRLTSRRHWQAWLRGRTEAIEG